MTKFRMFSLAVAALAVGLGGIYLWQGEATLLFVLPLLAVCFWLICLLRFLEIRAAGGTGIIALLPAVAIGLVAAAATFAALFYFVMAG